MTKDRNPIVYLAGPCFGTADLALNAENARSLRILGVDVRVPQVFAEDEARASNWKRVRELCLHHLEASDIVLANLDGPDIDSGTAYEIAMAVAWEKEILAVRSDTRLAGEGGKGNCMILNSPGLTLYTRFQHATDEIISRLPERELKSQFQRSNIRKPKTRKAKA